MVRKAIAGLASHSCTADRIRPRWSGRGMFESSHQGVGTTIARGDHNFGCLAIIEVGGPAAERYNCGDQTPGKTARVLTTAFSSPQDAEAEAVMDGHDACSWIQHDSTVSRALGCRPVSASTSFSTQTAEEPASTLIPYWPRDIPA